MLAIANELRSMKMQAEAFRMMEPGIDPQRALADLHRAAARNDSFKTLRSRKLLRDPEVVWSRWSAKSFAPEALDRLDWRTLCGASSTALRPQFIDCLERFPAPLERLGNLVGLVSAYFDAWRPEPVLAGRIETLIRRALDGPYSSSRNRVILSWQVSRFLFTAMAAERVADRILDNSRTPQATLEELFIERHSELAAAILVHLARKTVVALEKSASESSLLNRWRRALDHVFTRDLQPTVFRECMAHLIVGPLPGTYRVFRDLLVRYVSEDSRLGDPRLAENGPNWRPLPQEARQVFLGWLAERYIKLFFDIIVPPSDDNRRRAEFWLKYAKRGSNIKDFHVAVSPADLYKVRQHREARDLPFAQISAATGASSAFLMEFHGHGEQYIIVEFSETGKAACIYRKSERAARRIDLRRKFYTMDELWSTSARIDRITHLTGWEFGAGEKLRNMGITP